MRLALILLASTLSAQTWTRVPYPSGMFHVGWQKLVHDSVRGGVYVGASDWTSSSTIYVPAYWRFSAPSTFTKIGTSGSGSGSVTVSGSTVTRTGGMPFNTDGSWVGATIGIASTGYAVSAVGSASSLTVIGSPSNGTYLMNCPNNSATWFGDRHPVGQILTDTTRNRIWQWGGACTPNGGSPFTRSDMWYIDLSDQTWHPYSAAHHPYGNDSNMVYDPDDEVFFSWGYDGGSATHNVYVFCPTDRNPSPGTLTAAQTAAGCVNADDWTEVTGAKGTGGVTCASDYTKCPLGMQFSGLVYDTVNKKVIQFGGLTAGGTGNTDTWSYTVATQQWTKMAPASHPPAQNTTMSGQPAMAFRSVDGLVYLHQPHATTPHTWTYNYATDTWSDLGAIGGPKKCESIGYDPITDALYGIDDDGNGAIWYYQWPQPAATSNSITIKNTGSTTTNYPVQIGRPFALGEIPSGSLPRAAVDGVWVNTQVDVKARWDDGSLKHAILSFLIPAFTSGQTYTVSFPIGIPVENTALTQAQMLATEYNFDAVISLTKSGETKTASARTMLTNGDYAVWASGPIATTIMLGNHAQGIACGGNAASAYDFGFTSYCAFRPLFTATFWAGTNQVYVRYVGEIANTEQWENVATDSMLLTAGNTAPSTVYTRSTSLTMSAGSRWTKTAWIGGTPPIAAYNHNLTYLVTTKAIPNYNPSKSISESTISTDYAAWQAASKDLYEAGRWQKVMGAAGGRPDIGPYPSWLVRWLYTGDYRDGAISIGSAELAAAWPMHHREGKSGKYLDRSHAVPGIGKIMSVSTRPTICLICGYGYGYTEVADRVVPVGTVSDGGWLPDAAHQPDPYSPLYTLTGDPFYLEQMHFWASWTAAAANGAAYTSPIGRGPTGAEGGLPGSGYLQIRGQAWGLRSRAQTAFLSPDGSPEKTYFETLTNDALAIWEGQRNITGTAFQGSSNWNWGYAKALNNGVGNLWKLGLPALHFWEPGDAAFVAYPIDPAITSAGISTWEQNFLIYALGRTRELGFPATALLNWLGVNLISQATDPNYNPFLTGSYRLPTVKLSTGTYFTSWADVKTGYESAAQNGTSFDPMSPYEDILDYPSDGYPYFASAAMSMVADQAGGAAGWAFMAANVESYPATNTDPKWAILPRSIEAVSSAPAHRGGSVRGGSVR